MKRFKQQIVMLAGLMTVLGLTACSTSRLAERWNDTQYTGPKLQKMLVIGIMKDDIKRRFYEDQFVKAFSSGKRTAIASYNLMPDLREVDNKEKLLEVVRKAGADAVMITRLKAVKKEEREVPPRVDYLPTMGMGFGYYGYYNMGYQAVYSPGYTAVDTIVQLETRVFALPSEDLVWAGNTESVNSSSADKIISETAGLIISDMKQSGLID